MRCKWCGKLLQSEMLTSRETCVAVATNYERKGDTGWPRAGEAVAARRGPREIRPTRSSTLRCLESAGWLIVSGSVGSVTNT